MLAGNALAQTRILEPIPPGRVSVCQDYDGDGQQDLVFGLSDDSTRAINSGKIAIVSTKSWKVIKQRTCDVAESWMGGRVAVLDDLDKDGFNEILTTSDFRGQSIHKAWLLSGKDLSTIREYQVLGHASRLGACVFGVGDCDDDSVSDYCMTDPADVAPDRVGGNVAVYSGRTGDVIWRKTGGYPGAALGSSSTLVADYDGDGHGDILVSSRQKSQPGNTLQGTPSDPVVHVTCFSSKSGKELFQMKCGEPGRNFSGLFAVPDANKDGVGDFAIASFDFASVDSNSDLCVYSGADRRELFSLRKVLREWTATDPAGAKYATYCGAVGSACVSAGDWNGDAIDDLLVSDRQCHALWLCSGANGQVLKSLACSSLCGSAILKAKDKEGSQHIYLVTGPDDPEPYGIDELDIGLFVCVELAKLDFRSPDTK
jgi:hypothetical protein